MKNIIPLKRIVRFSVYLIIVILTFQNCNNDSCEYVTQDPPIKSGCSLVNSLNLSTGLDANGNLLSPGKGVVDPFWKLLNNPPLLSCTSPLTSTINGSAYVVNYSNLGSSAWVNQPTASTLAPLDLGTTDTFPCNNANNSMGNKVPYVFLRSFCVLKNTSVNLNFTFKGDDQVYFELVNNNTYSVLKTSTTYVWPGTTASWTESSVPLTTGSYSIRGYLVNVNSTVTGFSFSGTLTTTQNDLALSDNIAGCCENNTISILNILDQNCNKVFDSTDTVGNGFTFTVKNSSGTVIKTAVTDVNGNIFFSGLADGTYTVSVAPQGGYTPTLPTGGTATVIVSGNQIKMLEFYNCH